MKSRWTNCLRIGSLVVLAGVAVGCIEPPSEKVRVLTAGGAEEADIPSIDAVEIVKGVADRGRTPAVVAIEIGGEGLCTGTLIAPNAVLTARHCVSRTASIIDCPATRSHVLGDRPPETLSILVGESVAKAAWVASGEELFVPDSSALCGADLAVIVLDRVIAGIAPLAIRKKAVALGERIRAIGYGKKGDLGGAGEKVLRDYVRVEAVSKNEFLVAEATCQGDSGGPALDQTTGEILGVVSRGGPACEGTDVHNIYSRVDAFTSLIEAALGSARAKLKGAPKPSSEPTATPPVPKPAPDVGETCEAADDCAAGVCVHDESGSYCSRPCGEGMRCPTHFHCGKISERSVCLAVKP